MQRTNRDPLSLLPRICSLLYHLKKKKKKNIKARMKEKRKLQVKRD